MKDPKQAKKIVVGNVDLDAVVAGWLLLEDTVHNKNIIFINGNADSADLRRSSVLCIRAGGGGRVKSGNFDQIKINEGIKSATEQAADLIIPYWRQNDTNLIARLVQLVGLVVFAEGKIHPYTGGEVQYPSLNCLFEGVLILESKSGPVKQFREGIGLVKRVTLSRNDPFGPIVLPSLAISVSGCL